MKAPTTTKTHIFVAYAYNLFDKGDYRGVFSEVEKLYPVQFIFADEKITNMHIMGKISSYMKSAAFSIFDITGWNPNVTLELGYAMATSENWYISYNPKIAKNDDVPSDIRGIDRIQYNSFKDYTSKLLALMDQQFPKADRKAPITEHIANMQDQVLKILKTNDGLKISEIADLLGIDVRVAQLVVRPLNGSTLRSEGTKKGTRYYLA